MIKRNLPQGWEIKTLGEVCEKVQKRSKDYKGLEFDYIDISSINNKAHTIEKIERYNVANAPSRAQQIVQSNDILFSNVRTYLKNIAFVNEKYNDCIASTGFCVIRTKKDILLPKFMFYQALSNEFVFSLNKLQRGSSYPAVRNSDIFMQNIVIPPLETQQKIVAKLESEFAKIESAKSHLEKVKETIPRLKNSLLKSAFNGELTQSCKDKKGVPYRHCEDSSESEAIHNAESPLKDSIAESKACKIVDCHELRCNSRNDESTAQIPNSTQVPNLGGATLVAQNLQNGTNSPDCHLGHSETHKESICHSEALAEESQNIKPHKDSRLKDISATPQYDKTTSICHSDLECNEKEESKRYFANAQYEKDSNLPQDWEIKTLGEITNYGKTTQKCPKDLKPDDWILELEDIKKESGILLNKITFEERQSKSNKIIFYKGDVLFGTLRPYLKKVIIANDNGYCSSEIMPFNSGNEITNHYLAYLFLSDFMGNKIATLTYGTRMPRLGTKNGRELPIPLPPLETQKQIVEILDFKFAALENLEKETNASLEKLQRLKSSLLNLAFKGELIC